MSFFSRALVVVGVLGGLGYGSYAFGKYVLSAHLFGPNGSKIGAPKMASSGGVLESQPQVDVEVMPADSSGADSEPATRSARVDRESNPDILPTRSPDDPNMGDIPSDGSSWDDTTNQERPRKRRRRKHHNAEKPAVEATAAPAEASTSTRENTARATNRDETQDANPAPQAEAPRNDSDKPSGDAPRNTEAAPRVAVDGGTLGGPAESPSPRRRERERRSTEQARERTRERDRDRDTSVPAPAAARPAPRPEKRSDESPVPVPENSGGGTGDSPVPVPG